AEGGAVDIAERLAELSVVEKVEEFRAEVQTHIFPGQFELFDHGEISIDEIRTVDGNATGVAEFALSGVHKAGCVNVLGLSLVGIGIAAGNLVGAVEVITVAAGVKGDARRTRPAEIPVSTVNQGKGKAGRDFFDQRDLPAPEERIRHTVPIAAEALSVAEGQVIDNARGEIIVKVELRGSPIELLPIGQREIGRAQ